VGRFCVEQFSLATNAIGVCEGRSCASKNSSAMTIQRHLIALWSLYSANETIANQNPRAALNHPRCAHRTGIGTAVWSCRIGDRGSAGLALGRRRRLGSEVRDLASRAARLLFPWSLGSPAAEGIKCRREYWFQRRQSLFYFGGRNPGELAHSSIWDAMSACRAFFRSASCSGPGRSCEAFCLISLANEARRSFKEIVCLKW
jgi:hypothetical protein